MTLTSRAAVFALLLTGLAAQTPREGVYAVQNVHSGLFLNVEGGSLLSGANVWTWDNADSSHTQWSVRLAGEGAYTIQNVNSGLFLSVAEGAAQMGANVIVRDDGTAAECRWRLTQVEGSDGTAYQVQNAGNGLFLNLAGGSLISGANVHLWDNPGSTHSHWELIGVETCHDTAEGEKCFEDVRWALEHGIATRPEWYGGLNASASFADMQAHLHFCYWRRCPPPCAETREHGCGMVGRFWDGSSCEDAAAGSKCHGEVMWAMGHGILAYPQWYPGLTEQSSFKEFQARLFQGQKVGELHDCPEPCCHDTVPGELCYADASWAKAYGINSAGHAHVYPPSLTNTSALVEFQAYLHLCYPKRCPMPCVNTEVQARHIGQLDCPDQAVRL